MDLTGPMPGHVGVRISGDSASLLLVSDMLFHPVVHPPSPAQGFRLERDPAAAEAMHARLFPRTAAVGSLIVATRRPFPGLGRIIEDGSVRRGLPAEWDFPV